MKSKQEIIISIHPVIKPNSKSYLFIQIWSTISLSKILQDHVQGRLVDSTYFKHILNIIQIKVTQ